MTAKDEAHYVIYRSLTLATPPMLHDAAYAEATRIIGALEQARLTVRRGER